jgi:myo-inositol catabolism protein IolS
MKRAAKRSAPTPAPGELPAGFPMGKSGRIHPAIGLGLWNLGRWTPEGEMRVRSVVQTGLRLGIPWVDTAEVYGAGRSEQILGDALAALPHGAARPFLSTKLSYEHLHAPQIRPSLQASLRRLGLPSVDLYLVHFPNEHVPIADTMGELGKLASEGLVRAVGVSNFSLEELRAAEAALEGVPISAVQVQFNLFQREEAEPLLEHCRSRGIVVEAYSPLARGLLAGRYLERAPVRPDPRAGRGLYVRDLYQKLLPRVRSLHTLANESGCTLPGIALHWLLRRGAAPVVGAGSPEQVEALLANARQAPAPEVLDRADRIARGDAD